MISIKELNGFCTNTLIENLGIEFTEIGENFIKAKMPVDKRTLQPMGILHGGASLALAETIAGAGSLAMVDNGKYNVVGFQVNANHVGSETSGNVYALATLIHNGSRTHLWDIVITAEDGRKISLCRVTNMLVEKK
ncbi:MAG: thioesterase [Bacteroidetes bacterium HGW-Bacteroidetes-15]|nr:MAG: thioesterase [Bacteroidetes bacterium HGW-Bacteroidetes-15]